MKLLPVLLAAACVCPAQPLYELVLRGGRVIDPRNHIDGRRDVAVQGGKIAAVAASIDPSQAKKVVDVTGMVVTPGLVDIHVHAFHTTGAADAWAGDLSIAPDSFSFREGVTTMADAGSAGWRNFETFRHTVIDRVRTRVYAFINIAGYGMMGNINEQVPADFQPEAVARLARKHSDVVVGVKSAHYEKPDWTSVDRAVEAGTLANIPVMVDFGFFVKERPYYELVGKHLRPGDISTHVYRGAVPWIDGEGRLYPYLLEARRRGVKFDVGHGGGGFTFRNAIPAVRQGFYPDSISTDLHGKSMNAGMQDLPATMSKFLNMGMPLAEVILRTTWLPAQMIHRTERGHLTVGADADITVLRLMEGEFGFADSLNASIQGKQRLVAEMTILGGEVTWDLNARTATPYEKLGPTYGVRPGMDVLVLPPK